MATNANWQFRAVAIDYDGTLAHEERPNTNALAALRKARLQGVRTVLVTGRIRDELYEVFPDVEEHFDALVVENGAVLSIKGSVRLLAAPVAFELDEALVAQAVVFRRGQVLLATQARYEDTIQHEIRRLGLECQAVRNRDELMILPPTMSKGFGLTQALHLLRISPHSAIAFGDAENDHSLLSVCEIGVAVGNAVEGLKRHADVVLEAPNGAGVASMLEHSVLTNAVALTPRRWNMALGDFATGERATLPASQTNILIAGRSKSGKSHLGGSIAEALIELGYSICILDPEGDHAPLAGLQGVTHICLAPTDASFAALTPVLQQQGRSVVVDMSACDRTDVPQLADRLLHQLEQHRARTGQPHWVLIDEAHLAMASDSLLNRALARGDKGFCLITYRPQRFADSLHAAFDTILTLPGGTSTAGDDPLQILGEEFAVEWPPVGDHPPCEQAWMLNIGRDEALRTVHLRDRVTAHVRHRHKYADAPLAEDARFRFCDAQGQTLAVAHNVRAFRRLLQEVDPVTLRGHIKRGDFSHWIADALQDHSLAREVAHCEAQPMRTQDDLDRLRKQVGLLVDKRYAL